MGALLTATGIGAAAFVLGLLLRKLSAWPKLVPWLMLTAGWLVGGILGGLLARLAEMLYSVTNAATARLFGAGAGVVLTLGVAIFLVVTMKPKSSPHKMTPWLAFIFPALLVATGGSFANLHAAGGGLLAELGTAIVSLFPAIGAGL